MSLGKTPRGVNQAVAAQPSLDWSRKDSLHELVGAVHWDHEARNQNAELLFGAILPGDTPPSAEQEFGAFGFP